MEEPLQRLLNKVEGRQEEIIELLKRLVMRGYRQLFMVRDIFIMHMLSMNKYRYNN